MKNKFLLLFFLALCFSFAIRIYQMPAFPEGFDQTEASFGYNAYSILKTGRDEYGKLLPLVLTSFGDYKLAGYAYWQIPFIAIFGLNEFSLRLSTAVSGVISLPLVYYIVRELTGKRKLALLTMLFASISPWHLILSRMAYDPMIALMFYLFSVALFIRWYRNGRVVLLLFSAIAVSWSLATYYATWVVFPFTLLAFLVFIFKKHRKSIQVIPAGLMYLLPIFMIGALLMITRGERLNQDSTYQVHAFPRLEEQIREDQQEFPILVTRALHNKLVFYPQFILENFFKNLSFNFLFLSGDALDRRFWVPYQGVMYLWMAPFLLIGILYFWKNESLTKNLLLLGFIAITFLGSAFSELGSESERTIFAIPVLCFLVSYGVTEVLRNFRGRVGQTILFAVLILLAFNVGYFNHQYYWHANVHQPWGREYGMREMIESLPLYKSQYKHVIIPDSSYTFVYFYNKTDPRVAWAEADARLDQKNFLGLKLRAKVGGYMTMSVDCPTSGRLNVLYVCKGTKIPPNSKIIKVIRYRDGQPAFTFIELMPKVSQEAPPSHMEYMKNYKILDDKSEIYWE